MIAGCYVRKSNEQNVADDAKSVTRQIERAKEYASKKGWRFDEDLVFTDDGISGAEFKNRPGLTRLLETVKGKHKLGVLIVSEQSRLGRDTIRTLALIQALGDADVKIWSYLEDRPITLDDEMGEVEQFMKSWAGASERRKAGQRVRDKMRQLAEQGRFTGGRLFGYKTQDGQRVVKPSEAAIVRRIFTRRAHGAGYFKIARELERDGIASPRGGKMWSPNGVGNILVNEAYNGVAVYARTRQSKRRGTAVTEKSPEAIIRAAVPTLRIITPELWKTVQQVNQAATAATWRSKDGRLKSRPTESKHLLTPFLACGVCGGSMHVRVRRGKEFLQCTNHHHGGKARCSNGHRLAVPLAEKAILQAFEEALAGAIIIERMQDALERQRAAQADPEPLKAEAKSLRAEIARLVDQAARGDVEEIHDGIRTRKARLTQVDDMLAGTAAIQDLDVKAFGASIAEVAADWRGHLRRNKTVAAQVLRKILPTKVRVTPQPEGGWSFEGATSYTKVLEETGFEAVLDALKAQGWIDGATTIPHEVKHPAGECRPEYSCWPGTKVPRTHRRGWWARWRRGCPRGARPSP